MSCFHSVSYPSILSDFDFAKFFLIKSSALYCTLLKDCDFRLSCWQKMWTCFQLWLVYSNLAVWVPKFVTVFMQYLITKWRLKSDPSCCFFDLHFCAMAIKLFLWKSLNCPKVQLRYAFVKRLASKVHIRHVFNYAWVEVENHWKGSKFRPLFCQPQLPDNCGKWYFYLLHGFVSWNYM